MEILLTGNRLGAEEAYRIGLVNAVVPPEQVMERAEEYARRIADNGPLAVRKIKESALRGLATTVPEAMRIEAECAAVVFASEDAKEGPRAFIEKRAPRFTGR
jgi:enoyl-CoA hydratase